VNFDDGIRVSDGPTIIRNQEWDSLSTDLNSLYFAELVLKEKEIISGLLNFYQVK